MAKYGKGNSSWKKNRWKTRFACNVFGDVCYADKAAEKHLQSSKKNY